MSDARSFPECFDPYLRYAITHNFINFEFFDEDHEFRLFFLVEFRHADQANKFEAALNELKLDAALGPIAENHLMRYRTLRAAKGAVTERAAVDLWDQYVTRVELSLPLKPDPPLPFDRIHFLADRSGDGKTPTSELLIGVLDDGCPFAASQFLRASQIASTQVLAIWDQDPNKQPAHINLQDFGMQLPDFKYGLEYRRDFKPGTIVGPPQIGMDDWMQLHRTPAGSIDEDSCYEDSPIEGLRRRESHGAHVMDVMVGHLPPSSRIGPTRPGTDHRDPPSWNPAQPTTDPACAADVVFVQFPRAGIRDATGVWLKAYVLHGIQYILSFAGPQTKRVIVNLSYGPTTGPHNGTAALEATLSTLAAQYNGTANTPKLEIFLAGGNSYLTDGHVNYINSTALPAETEWVWCLLPDNPVLCFCEVWIDNQHATGVKVTLTPPGGGAVRTITSQVWGNSTIWLLDVGPTMPNPNATPEPSGDYVIKVSGIAPAAEVNAYVARTDPNLGVRTHSKRSYFVDPAWEQTHSASADCTYVDGEFDNTGSLISRYGTLNGIATALDPSIHVAGGDMLFDGRKAPYASAGPARGNPMTRRVGPDFALFCDESYALKGVRAGGTRSGIVFRMIGTSTASPQLARRIAEPTTLGATNPPATLQEREQRGAGNIAPPPP
jgi:hypothetical protein